MLRSLNCIALSNGIHNALVDRCAAVQVTNLNANLLAFLPSWDYLEWMYKFYHVWATINLLIDTYGIRCFKFKVFLKTNQQTVF